MEAHSPPASSSCGCSPGLCGGHDGVRTGPRENLVLELRGREEHLGMGSERGDRGDPRCSSGAPESAQHSPPGLRFLLGSRPHCHLRVCTLSHFSRV